MSDITEVSAGEQHPCGDAFQLRSNECSTKEGKATVLYVVCTALEESGFLNAFSTRLGGVSRLPAESLNLGYFKNDPSSNVAENRRRFLDAIGASGTKLATLNQTHSVNIYHVKSQSELKNELKDEEPDADALVTKEPNIVLAVKTADCLPILIADPKSGVIAAIHAGWRGTAGRITERTLADLMRDFGVNTRNCLAALGPAACGDCYEVGRDVIDRFKSEFGYWSRLLKPKNNGKANLDIQAANRQQLAYCGFSDERIFTAPYCTMHNNDSFFSYRREGSGVGKMLSVIGRYVFLGAK
ncbi:MAG TPA: peptidoglycan editing factor PgeF [Blastocatellia bacterium]|nr:peptidoglycan editing factor PgeF [Blastocatellia bacterium]